MRSAEGKSRNVSSIPQGSRTDCVHPQKAFWIVKNDRIIDEVNHLGPRDFYNKLLARDDVAWKSVKTLVVDPIFRQQKYAEMAHEKSIDPYDAYGFLCLTMLQGERLKRARNPNNLKAWMQSYVRKFIRSFFTEKEKRIVSVETKFGGKRYVKKDDGSRMIEDPISAIVDVKQERNRVSGLGKDEKKDIQDKFHKLWKTNPLKAYVLMFRMKENLPSKDIKVICGVSSDDNVNKLIERAKDDIAVMLTGKPAVRRVVRRDRHV